MRIPTIAALVVALGAGGCAMVEHGVVDQLHVTTDPPGARATASTGASCMTPCSLELPRKDDVTIAVEKTGYQYQSTQVKIRSTASEAALSPDMTPDYLGRVFDAQYGASFVHVPNPVHFKLVPTTPPG